MTSGRDHAAHVLFVVARCDLLKDYGMMRHLVRREGGAEGRLLACGGGRGSGGDGEHFFRLKRKATMGTQ